MLYQEQVQILSFASQIFYSFNIVKSISAVCFFVIFYALRNTRALYTFEKHRRFNDRNNNLRRAILTNKSLEWFKWKEMIEGTNDTRHAQ